MTSEELYWKTVPQSAFFQSFCESRFFCLQLLERCFTMKFRTLLACQKITILKKIAIFLLFMEGCRWARVPKQHSSSCIFFSRNHRTIVLRYFHYYNKIMYKRKTNYHIVYWLAIRYTSTQVESRNTDWCKYDIKKKH